MKLDSDFIISNCVPSDLLAKNIKPYDFQFTGITTLFGKSRFLLADDPGLGKTVQAIVAVNLAQLNKETPLRVLVVTTKTMVITWQREIKKWGNNFSQFQVINHDRLIIKSELKDYISPWDIFLCDEPHLYIRNDSLIKYIKDEEGKSKRKKVAVQRSEAIFKIVPLAGRTWLMTATPASKTAVHYYNFLRILLPTIFMKWTRKHFMTQFCEEVQDRWSYSGVKYIGFKNTDKLKEIFKVCALRRRQEEVKADLPPLIFSDRFADTNYQDLENFTPDEAHDIKERVLSGKALSSEHQGKIQRNAFLKIPAVIDILKTFPDDKKVVIFAWHKDVIAALVKEISKETDRTVDFINSEVTDNNKRQAIIDRGQEGDLNTICLNMQSGGTGITLTKFTAAIYIQFPYALDHWIQSIKRVHRIGSELPVEIIKVMFDNGIDEDLFESLEEARLKVSEVGV